MTEERFGVSVDAGLQLCHATRTGVRILALELQSQGISQAHEALKDAREAGPFLLASWMAGRTGRRPRG
jgi:hypothetical protein